MSSVGELVIYIGSLFPEMGSLTEQAKTAVAQLEVVSSKVSLRWRLKKFRPRQVKASVEYFVGQDEVSAKPATLERKKYSVDEAWPRMAALSYL